MKNPTLLTLVLCFFFCLSSSSQTINTIAGGYRGDGKTALEVSISPISQAVDAAGNIYFAEPDKQVVRKLSTSGVYSTVAGNGIFGYSGDGGPATEARLKNPYCVAVDPAGNLYINDAYDHVVRKVFTNGIITTIAGNGTPGFSGDGGPATAAQLNGPNGLATDLSGNLYITDFQNNRVRKVAANGIISTFAGNGNFGFQASEAPATSVSMGLPLGVAVKSDGSVYISEVATGVVRKVNPSGNISLVAGNGIPGFAGDGGYGTNSRITVTGSVAIDAAGNIYIPDTDNNRIRKVDANGFISTMAGNGLGTGMYTDNTPAVSAIIPAPTGVSIEPSGNLLVTTVDRISRVIMASGLISTIAGNISSAYAVGKKDTLEIYPADMITGATGEIYFIQGTQTRKLTPGGFVSTFAGSIQRGFGGDGGDAVNALLSYPQTLTRDTAGNTYISDLGNYRIRKVSKTGVISTFAGNGIRGFSGDGGFATDASFTDIHGLATDLEGNVFVSDGSNNRIRKIDKAGIVTTIAGTGEAGNDGDGGPALNAQLNYPSQIATDKAGNLFVSDQSYRVRKITLDGFINTVAGNGSSDYAGDGGKAIDAGILPGAIAIDDTGNIFISDLIERIRKVSTGGIITTFAGGGTDFGEGALANTASIAFPQSLQFDTDGNLLFSERYNNRIRKVGINPINVWTGALSNQWENPGNWSLHVLPGSNTNVKINTGNPVVNSNISIRSLKLAPGTSLHITPGYMFSVLH